MRMTRRAVREWLEGMPPEEVAGRCGLPCECPLAQFVTSRGGGDAHVGGAYYRYSRSGRRHTTRTPDWAAKLMKLVDGPLLYKKRGWPITAGQVLQLLGTVP